jgi:hypothetical protein
MMFHELNLAPRPFPDFIEAFAPKVVAPKDDAPKNDAGGM